MTETASLHLKVDDSQVAAATTTVDALGKKSIKTEKATDKLKDSVDGLGKKSRKTKGSTKGLGKEVDTLGRKTRKTKKATDGLTLSFGRMLGAALTVGTAITGLSKIVSVNREFGVLNASLITATGSAEGAKEAFGALEDFAKTTPFDLAQASSAFVKLVNFGLDPSVKAMTSFGNTASALGTRGTKSLQQVIEAVADSVRGEFERLKELGIQANKQGEEVTFTFQGIATTVKNTSKDIEGYLIALGENKFGDAMANRMKTLDGVISNFGDTWDAMFRKVGDKGATNLIIEGIKDATTAVDDFIMLMDSNVIPEHLKVIGKSFEGWGGDVTESVNIVGIVFHDFFETITDQGVSATTGLELIFSSSLINIRTFVKLMTIEAASEFDKLSLASERLEVHVAKKWLDFARRSPPKLTPFLMNLDVTKDALKVMEEVGDGTNTLQSKIDAINTARIDSLSAIINEGTASTNALFDQIHIAGAASASFDKLKKSKQDALGVPEEKDKKKSKPKKDPLKKFGVRAKREAAGVKAGPSAAEQKAFSALKLALRSEEQVILDSYKERAKIIKVNTIEGSEEAAKQMKAIAKERNEDLAAINKGFWQTYAREVESQLTSLSDLASETLNSFSSGVGGAFEDMVFEAKTFGDAVNGLTEGLARGLVNAAGKMAAEWLLYQAIKLAATEATDLAEVASGATAEALKLAAIETAAAAELATAGTTAAAKLLIIEGLAATEIATAVTTAASIAVINKTTAASAALSLTAYAEAGVLSAGIHAFSSTAAIPIVGPAAAPAAMALAIAATQPLAAGVAGLATGAAITADTGGFIPAGKIGIVGEIGPELVTGPMKVTSRKKTSDLLGGMGKGGGDTINITNVNQIQLGVDTAVRTELARLVPQILESTKKSVINAMYEGGAMSRAAGRR